MAPNGRGRKKTAEDIKARATGKTAGNQPSKTTVLPGGNLQKTTTTATPAKAPVAEEATTRKTTRGQFPPAPPPSLSSSEDSQSSSALGNADPYTGEEGQSLGREANAYCDYLGAQVIKHAKYCPFVREGLKASKLHGRVCKLARSRHAERKARLERWKAERDAVNDTENEDADKGGDAGASMGKGEDGGGGGQGEVAQQRPRVNKTLVIDLAQSSPEEQDEREDAESVLGENVLEARRDRERLNRQIAAALDDSSDSEMDPLASVEDDGSDAGSEAEKEPKKTRKRAAVKTEVEDEPFVKKAKMTTGV